MVMIMFFLYVACVAVFVVAAVSVLPVAIAAFTVAMVGIGCAMLVLNKYVGFVFLVVYLTAVAVLYMVILAVLPVKDVASTSFRGCVPSSTAAVIGVYLFTLSPLVLLTLGGLLLLGVVVVVRLMGSSFKGVPLGVRRGLVALVVIAMVVGCLLIALPVFGVSDTFDCGFDAFGDTRHPVDIVYARFGILFLLFDVEAVLLYPLVPVVDVMGSVGVGVGIDLVVELCLGLWIGWPLVSTIGLVGTEKVCRGVVTVVSAGVVGCLALVVPLPLPLVVVQWGLLACVAVLASDGALVVALGIGCGLWCLGREWSVVQLLMLPVVVMGVWALPGFGVDVTSACVLWLVVEVVGLVTIGLVGTRLVFIGSAVSGLGVLGGLTVAASIGASAWVLLGALIKVGLWPAHRWVLLVLHGVSSPFTLAWLTSLIKLPILFGLSALPLTTVGLVSSGVSIVVGSVGLWCASSRVWVIGYSSLLSSGLLVVVDSVATVGVAMVMAMLLWVVVFVDVPRWVRALVVIGVSGLPWVGSFWVKLVALQSVMLAAVGSGCSVVAVAWIIGFGVSIPFSVGGYLRLLTVDVSRRADRPAGPRPRFTMRVVRACTPVELKKLIGKAGCRYDPPVGSIVLHAYWLYDPDAAWRKEVCMGDFSKSTRWAHWLLLTFDFVEVKR